MIFTSILIHRISQLISVCSSKFKKLTWDAYKSTYIRLMQEMALSLFQIEM
jgi:hypothetical protein